ncbi:TIGR04282 family arsenosugar biosynthesis glycosyltransferase [Galbibacter mesophilus]|uniref:TIGR04282 family arsenosugar biosynthesis glycosyltransferase n=1 Tax=Galbibacter mesophilus TaxID=379069 RepID=UPI00191CCE3E|nr:TIGR04282 family arsenosugar biosynthesis glycosyltransferase [Galbibacter mesophilus]MCM5661978.1 TIGR04282 family arsenosugar biosynthesis glycosyltransferase [Galbibacter mesophilus]
MVEKNNALLIFTRNPELGKVKTRLAKTVGNEKALGIYLFLLKHTQQIAKKINGDVFVFYSEEIAEDDIWNDGKFSKKIQKGNNLGERMKNAFEEIFRLGYKKAVIIGSDLYDLTTQHIDDAFQKLEINDAVVGPAQDGGYYLLGLKQLHPTVFQQKKWGTNTVLRDTLQSLHPLDVALLEERNDVDVYDDIKEHPAFQKFLSK